MVDGYGLRSLEISRGQQVTREARRTSCFIVNVVKPRARGLDVSTRIRSASAIDDRRDSKNHLSDRHGIDRSSRESRRKLSG